MEKYSLYADYLTGKLLFNYPLPLYTALPLVQKIAYYIYIYTLYWILIVARLINLFLLPAIWLVLQYVPIIGRMADLVFPRIILFNAGYFVSPKVMQGKTSFYAKLEPNRLVCGTLTSPFDILVYSRAFKVRHVLLPECFLADGDKVHKDNRGSIYKVPSAFLYALFLEDLLYKQSTSKTQNINMEKIAKIPLLCFPEGTSTNGTGVLQSYLPDNFFQNRQIIAASCARPWRRVPRVHSRFGWNCIFDSLGAISTRCTVKALVLYPDPRRIASSVISAMAGAQGVYVCQYTIDDKIRYGLNAEE